MTRMMKGRKGRICAKTSRTRVVDLRRADWNARAPQRSLQLGGGNAKRNVVDVESPIGLSPGARVTGPLAAVARRVCNVYDRIGREARRKVEGQLVEVEGHR
jgi:hypothetical protein